MNLETQKHAKHIKIHQSQLDHKPWPVEPIYKYKVLFPKMIDGRVKRKCQLAFELQSSRVFWKAQ